MTRRDTGNYRRNDNNYSDFPRLTDYIDFGFGERTTAKKSSKRNTGNYRRSDNYFPDIPGFTNDSCFEFGEKKTPARKYPKRDTCNYKLKDKNKIVYHGITNDLDRRLEEHIRSGKEFTSCEYSVKRSRASALRHEREDITRYSSRKGEYPKYNKIK